jgi:hypothetical protein
VKRYLNWCEATHGHEMMERSDGSWVLDAEVMPLLDFIEELAGRDCAGYTKHLAETPCGKCDSCRARALLA